MKIASFDQQRIGIVDGDTVVDVSELAGDDLASWPPTAMLRFITSFDRIEQKLSALPDSASRTLLSKVRLNCPILWPNKVIAYPANYHDHISEMKTGTGLISTFNASGQGFFLKASSSLSGPLD